MSDLFSVGCCHTWNMCPDVVVVVDVVVITIIPILPPFLGVYHNDVKMTPLSSITGEATSTIAYSHVTSGRARTEMKQTRNEAKHCTCNRV